MKELIRTICEDAQEVSALEVHNAEPHLETETDEAELVRLEALSILRNIISESLKIPEELVEDDYPLDEYGIDSVTNLELIQKMEEVAGALPKTLFFEYNTLEELADFFVSKHYDAVFKIVKQKMPKVMEMQKSETVSASELVRQLQKPKTVPMQIEEYKESDIAIIGVSGKYPKAENLKEFWNNLKEGKDCITEVPKDRWDTRIYYSPDKEDKRRSYLKEGGFIDGVYEFDPLFFSISPREAKYTDPQDRLFLQCCYETLEDAGYTREKLKKMKSSGMSGNVGVFAGVMWEEYQMFGAQEQLLGNPVWMTGYPASISNKVSYFFNLHGPSMTIDTMCSSSLTALHLACQSIRDGECDAAIAGGVNLSLHPNKYFLLSNNKFASSRGKCESFGNKGDGYVPGEGVGAVMLKPLKKAEADGDQIYGVIKADAVNHGGKTSSYTVPNPNAQANVIETVFRKSGINPRTVSYIEAHGTGTSLGDPIEIAGLNQVFEKYTDDKQFCSIGSVKSNIGHLEGAAGIVSLTKVLLQMKNKMIVPSLHSKTLNPYIDFKNSPFKVPQKLIPWERPQIEEDGILKEYPRRACISSFGAGGSNAHILVEEYEKKEPVFSEKSENKKYAVILSARLEEQLNRKVSELYHCISEKFHSECYLQNIAYMLQTGRESFDYRLGFCVSSIDELLKTLKAYMDKRATHEVIQNHVIRNAEQVKALGSEETKMEIETFMKTKSQKELMELWVKGCHIQWEDLYHGMCIEKISLPTYPFARDTYCGIDRMKKYLFGDSSSIQNGELLQEETIIPIKEEKKEDDCTLLTFQERWVKRPMQNNVQKHLKLVCFAEDTSLMQTVWEETEIFDKQTEIIWIVCGAGYEKKSRYEYRMEYEQKEDYIKCFQEIKKDFGAIDYVLYLNPLLNQIYQQEVSGLICMYQALYAAKLTELTLLLAGAYQNLLEKAYVESWIGMERSIAITALNMKAGVVLYDRREGSTADFIHTMLAECFLGTSNSVWYDQGVRKELKIQPVSLKEDKPCRIKKHGTYVITGGMGGLGILFARHISKCFDANIVLTGRRSMEEVSEKLEELKSLGMNVIYVSADVSNAAQMKQVVKAAKDTFGTLNGVIHAAGLSEGKNIIKKEYEEYERIIRPKVQGTIALEKALEGEDIDFICYFSSSSAILGDFGSFDYAVGNRFLMSYAEYRRQQASCKGETFVVEWPLWRDGGMGFKTQAAERMYLKTSGQKCLREKEGTLIFDKIFQSDVEDCLVMYGTLDRVNKMLGISLLDKAEENFIEKNTTLPVNIVEKEGTSVEEQEIFQERGKGYKDNMRGWSLNQCLMSDLKNIINDILSVPFNQMDENLHLADFGFDSVTLSEFAKRISSLLELDVTPDLFYRYATLNELIQYFEMEQKETIGRFYHPGSSKPVVQKTEVKKTEEKKEETGHKPKMKTEEADSIAVVGISGKFPDADNTEELWKILSQGKEVIREVPERKGWDDKKLRIENMKMGVVRDIDQFDSAFFEISPREACTMEPRQRILLEETWKALEDAGIGEYEIHNEKIGMFVGAEDGDYQYLDGQKGSITANHNAILAARLAYFLNLNGPNMSINTACSSGLVAVHQACQSLRSGECDIAIAAGVNLFCTPVGYKGMDEAGMLSKTRTCYALDKRADGMVPAEAVAVVVLKKMKKAEKDGNVIYGEVIASGINYDGRTNGITAPSGRAQSMLLEDVYDRFSINPKDIDYIVTHGTGTRIGDPIEINALASVFEKAGVEKGNCALTSIKPNLGHALAASGVVSLISLLLAMKNKTIPGEIHCEQQSDYINWDKSPFYINTNNRPWKDGEKLRIGAVNAFGMSGTNAHVVIRSVPKEEVVKKKNYPAYLIAFSAKTEDALNRKCKDLFSFIKNKKTMVNMEDISYTLIDGRQHFAHRIAFMASDAESAQNTLQQLIEGKAVENCCRAEVPRTFRVQSKIQKMVRSLCQECRKEKDVQAYQENIAALAQFYSLGYEIYGFDLFEQGSVEKISVPVYPFEKKQYWLIPVEKKEIKTEKSVVKTQVKPVVKPQKKERKKPVQSLEKLMTDLAESLAKELFLETEEIEYDKGFLEMGLDSIVGVEWIKHINEKYHTSLESTKIYQYPTIAEFAGYIYSQQTENEKQTKSEAVSKESVETVEIPKGKVLLQPLDNEALYMVSPAPIPEEKIVLSDLGIKEEVSQPAVKENILNIAPNVQNMNQKVDLEQMMKELAASLADELFMETEDVEYDKGFMEMGLDSIVGVEWMRHINKKYGTNIESTKIYQYSTIVELAGYICSIMQGEPVTKTKSVEPGSLKKLMKDLAESLAEELFMDAESIEYDKGFIEMGLDSVIGVEWIHHINQKYHTHIETTKIYQYSSISELASYIIQQMNGITTEIVKEKEGEEKEIISDEADLNTILYKIYQGEVDIDMAEAQFTD